MQSRPRPAKVPRQPTRSMASWARGENTPSPAPIPAKAMPMAEPRDRTNQFDRSAVWATGPRMLLPRAATKPKAIQRCHNCWIVAQSTSPVPSRTAPQGRTRRGP